MTVTMTEAMTLAEARKLVSRVNGAEGEDHHMGWVVAAIEEDEQYLVRVTNGQYSRTFSQANLRRFFGDDEFYEYWTPFTARVEKDKSVSGTGYFVYVEMPECRPYFKVCIMATWGIWRFKHKRDADAFVASNAWKMSAMDRLDKREFDSLNALRRKMGLSYQD